MTNGIALVAGAMLTALTAGAGMFVAAPILLITVLGGISIFFFARNRAQSLGVSKRQAAMAYITAVVMANESLAIMPAE